MRKAIVKRYLFKAGQGVPTWLMRCEFDSHASYAKSRNVKITFGATCIVSRVLNSDRGAVNSLVVPVNKPKNNYKALILIERCHDAIIGGINGASGSYMVFSGNAKKAWEEYLFTEGFLL